MKIVRLREPNHRECGAGLAPHAQHRFLIVLGDVRAADVSGRENRWPATATRKPEQLASVRAETRRADEERPGTVAREALWLADHRLAPSHRTRRHIDRCNSRQRVVSVVGP